MKLKLLPDACRRTGGRRFLLLLLLLLAVMTTVQARPAKDLTGKVTDEKGEPVPGVTILLKGTTIGTTTNAEGLFSLSTPAETGTLVISFVGYLTQEVPLGNATNLHISLKVDARALEEVVVVGYGEQKKAHLTGSVAQVSMAEIEDLPVGNLATALSGRLAGVAVSGGTTRPGQAASIVIRNPIMYSKDGGTLSPLYVIDGVIRSEEDFNILDVSEVESITLLKDAAAAIYGARSAQGVVLVKTKTGKAGKPKINYSGSAGMSDATYMPRVMNAYEHASYLNTLVRTEKDFVADGTSGYLADPDYFNEAELAHFRANNYNWLEMAWKPSYTTRHAVNVSGGNERATFFAGASYYNQDGNFDNINMDKWTFRANTDVKVAQGLRFGFSVSGDLSTTKKYNSKLNSSEEADMISLLKIPQWTPPYINGLPVNLAAEKGYHFFEIQRINNYKRARTTGLNINTNLEYEFPFLKGLKARVQFSKNLDNKYSKEYATSFKVYNFQRNGHLYTDQLAASNPIVTLNNGDRVFVNPDYSDNYQINGFLNYDRQFGKHNVSGLVLVEQNETYWEEVRSLKEGLVEGGWDFMNMAFGGMDAATNARESGNLSYVGRVNYNYAGKYLLELAGRYDASTKFAPKYRWGLFPSLSAGWVISEEPFFKNNVTTVNTLKLRGSVGLLGGDQAKAWLWRQRYTFNTNGAVFGGDNNQNRYPGLKMEAMPNPYVQWDDVTKVNVGVDAGFLDNRLSATLDAFHDHRYNMLYTRGASIPLTVGGTMPDENYATVNSFGYEVSVGWKDRVGSDANYYVNGFFSWSDNKRILVDYAAGEVGTWRYPINQSTDMGVEGYRYLGMFRTQEEVDRFLETNPGYTIDGLVPEPGMLYYQDLRGPRDANGQFTAPDGKITEEDDMDWISPKASNHYGFGVSLGAGWKGLKLDMVIAGAFGGQATVEGNARRIATATENRPAFWADHWTPETPNARYPNPYYETNTWMSEFWFRNSFSLRMRSFNLSYSLPKSLTGNLNARAFFNGTNPFNFYNPFGYKDPAGSFDAYPNVKTFNLGLNFTL